jgi:hypothetical protein
VSGKAGELRALSHLTGMVRDAFTGAGKWLFGILAGALATLIGAYAIGLFNAFLPSPQEVACRIGELDTEPAPGTHFTVLVSDLAGDTDDKQIRLIADTLNRRRGLHVMRTCRVLRLPERGLIRALREPRPPVAPPVERRPAYLGRGRQGGRRTTLAVPGAGGRGGGWGGG